MKLMKNQIQNLVLKELFVYNIFQKIFMKIILLKQF